MYADWERLPVTETVMLHLLNPQFCGLFDSEWVLKHKALDTYVYWIDPAVPRRVQEIIRQGIMPTVSSWTHGAWTEVSIGSPYTFNWVSDMPSPYPEAGGLAIPGGDVWLSDREANTQRESPPEIVHNNGLHEAAHALFYAVHSTQGLMCISEDCFGVSLREPGVLQSWDWKWRGPVSQVEHMVYRTYGNPLFKNGMTKQEVRDRLDIVEAKRAPGCGATTLLAGLVGLLVLGVGWAILPSDSIAEARPAI